MSRFVATIKHAFAEMIPPTIYFFVILHIVAFIPLLMNKHTGIEFARVIGHDRLRKMFLGPLPVPPVAQK